MQSYNPRCLGYLDVARYEADLMAMGALEIRFLAGNPEEAFSGDRKEVLIPEEKIGGFKPGMDSPRYLFTPV